MWTRLNLLLEVHQAGILHITLQLRESGKVLLAVYVVDQLKESKRQFTESRMEMPDLLGVM